jgi:hypothetical protein
MPFWCGGVPLRVIIFLAFIASANVYAAEFVWQPGQNGNLDDGTVFVNGEIELNDHEKLLAALGDHQGSPGMPVFVQLARKIHGGLADVA